ncbi:hypothetical protein BBW65_04480 [Helicobacter enhydrae]|uniref:Uncharacterized protein n=1 Tax=Helicobacter enhydrae TaxID=222136 RepID=A0A1B1U5X9_9HELI|nr:hypothetical protein [Helicobacter enhydrae]ANV98102.1 hypothetical protein BBW65_04480 [Helicobacter enhydrae]
MVLIEALICLGIFGLCLFYALSWLQIPKAMDLSPHSFDCASSDVVLQSEEGLSFQTLLLECRTNNEVFYQYKIN